MEASSALICIYTYRNRVLVERAQCSPTREPIQVGIEMGHSPGHALCPNGGAAAIGTMGAVQRSSIRYPRQVARPWHVPVPRLPAGAFNGGTPGVSITPGANTVWLSATRNCLCRPLLTPYPRQVGRPWQVACSHRLHLAEYGQKTAERLSGVDQLRKTEHMSSAATHLPAL